MEAVILLIVSGLAFVNYLLRDIRNPIRKIPIDVLERYLGQKCEWEHLPFTEWDKRLRNRGWDVNGTDLVEDTCMRMRNGTLRRIGS